MINKIYAEAQRIGREGLGTISLAISTYEQYDMLGCTYYPPGWHEAQRAVDNGTATPEQLATVQSSTSLAIAYEVNDEDLANLLLKLEQIQW
ncbi:MAG: hypothetical protein IBX55_17095 [Methyloprofundus sp.]|nr:hypothetical protein [Methyloprofundus sp.]